MTRRQCHRGVAALTAQFLGIPPDELGLLADWATRIRECDASEAAEARCEALAYGADLLERGTPIPAWLVALMAETLRKAAVPPAPRGKPSDDDRIARREKPRALQYAAIVALAELAGVEKTVAVRLVASYVESTKHGRDTEPGVRWACERYGGMLVSHSSLGSEKPGSLARWRGPSFRWRTLVQQYPVDAGRDLAYPPAVAR